MTLLKNVHLCLMSANVQLDNRCNLMDFVRRYITFCNALTGHFTRMHNESCSVRVINTTDNTTQAFSQSQGIAASGSSEA